jgi:STE24 endopeptidase
MAAQPSGGDASAGLTKRLLWIPAAAVFAGAWIFAASRLLRTTVPGDLHLPKTDPHDYFSSSYLDRASSFEAFLRIDFVLSVIVLLVAFALYAMYGARFTRESAAGRIGTGMLLGMLGFAIVWLTQLPFGLAEVWWERRHHISKQGYLEWLAASWQGLGQEFLFICVAIAIVMALAGPLKRLWWVAAAPILAALALLSALVQPAFIPDLHPLRNDKVAADARELKRAEGLSAVPVKVQKVHKSTTAPNAEAVGIGPTRRVILWDTLLDGRFSRREVRVILAHELGHVKRNHVLKGIGWFALITLPLGAAIALATRRRGGMYFAEAVPVALLVLVALEIALIPAVNVLTRRVEAEADWIGLNTTRDPAAARSAFHELSVASLSQPRPPTWAYLFFENHPTIIQRIAMADAWEARERDAGARSR